MHEMYTFERMYKKCWDEGGGNFEYCATFKCQKRFFTSRGERNPTLPLYLFYFIYFILFILFLYTFFDISKSIRIKNQILNLF